ncbi:MAG: MarR family transcriptional regulator [Firmicutes bacterium]|nr:MarR family transcriptional regulator [Bacillota bacterium]
MQDSRYEKFCQVIDLLDEGVEWINAYDALLHDYGGVVMFQAESQMIKAIGNAPGITASQLAKGFDKTTSACSQLIRKLKQKEWVVQNRNAENSREYNLYLTEAGREIYEKHKAFETACYLRTFEMLKDVSEEELEVYIKIQTRLNKAFSLDVSESKQL